MSMRHYNATRSQLNKTGEKDPHFLAKIKVKEAFLQSSTDDNKVFAYVESEFKKNTFNSPQFQQMEQTLQEIGDKYGVPSKQRRDPEHLNRPFVLVDPESNQNIYEIHRALKRRVYPFYRHSFDVVIVIYGDRLGELADIYYVEVDNSGHDKDHQQYNDGLAEENVRKVDSDAYFVRIRVSDIEQLSNKQLVKEIVYRAKHPDKLLEFGD